MKHQQLYSKTRQAVDDYHMIEANDRIAVGLSGGKDSLALLYALHGLQRFYPVPFSIVAVTVDLGFDGQDFSGLTAFCRQLDIPYHTVPTQIAGMIRNAGQEEHPCPLCSRLRKGALNQKLIELQCNKLAYGHHRDDVVDTMMLSLIYEGRWNTFSPVTHLDRTGLTLIRPLIYVKEADIKGWIKMYGIPVQSVRCPADRAGKRESVKEMLRMMGREAPGVRERMFTAIRNSDMDGWMK